MDIVMVFSQCSVYNDRSGGTGIALAEQNVYFDEGSEIEVTETVSHWLWLEGMCDMDVCSCNY